MFSAWDSFKELAQGDQYENEDGTPKYNDRGVAEFHISEKEWLAAEASYKKQQAAISQAQASLSSSWQAYQATQDSEVVAILAGEVRNLGITKGDLVTAPSAVNLSSTPPALILLSSDVKTTIKLNIEETDIVKLKEGQSAQVEIDAFPNQLFPGKVDRVDTIAVPSNGIVTYSVYVSLDEHNNSLRSGMTADVSITVASKDNILTVPSSAVKPYEGGRAVRGVGENGEIKYLPVEIGSRGEGKTEIISGIQEGQEVIVALTNDQVERPGGLF